MTITRNEVKAYLTNILKTETLTDGERRCIEGTLTFFEKEIQEKKQKWKLFVENLKKQEEIWNVNPPIEGYQYKFSFQEMSWTLYLTPGDEDNAFTVLQASYDPKREFGIDFYGTIDVPEPETFDTIEQLESAVELAMRDKDFDKFIEIIKECIENDKNA